jgi:hypothetical protein
MRLIGEGFSLTRLRSLSEIVRLRFSVVRQRFPGGQLRQQAFCPVAFSGHQTESYALQVFLFCKMLVSGGYAFDQLCGPLAGGSGPIETFIVREIGR